MVETSSMVWVHFDSLILVAHRNGPIVEADFDRYIDELNASTQLTGLVVRACDAAPSPRHRGQLVRWFQGRAARAAVLTDSLVARGAVTAIGWFGAAIRAYAPPDVPAALRYAGVAEDRLNDAIVAFNDLIAVADSPRKAAG